VFSSSSEVVSFRLSLALLVAVVPALAAVGSGAAVAAGALLEPAAPLVAVGALALPVVACAASAVAARPLVGCDAPVDVVVVVVLPHAIITSAANTTTTIIHSLPDLIVISFSVLYTAARNRIYGLRFDSSILAGVSSEIVKKRCGECVDAQAADR
jgi:hypothetical protein